MTDTAYAAEVLRLLEQLRIALISCNRPDADQCARRVEVMVRAFVDSAR